MKITSSKAIDYFNTFISTSANLIAIVDEKKRITYINKNMANFAGVADPERCLNKSFLRLWTNPELKKVFREILETDQLLVDLTNININGQVRSFKIISAPVFGKTSDIFIQLVDLTDIIKVKEEAEAASRAKSEFLASISHEIRTPMNTILGLSALMDTNELDDKHKQYINEIKKMSGVLINIINDVLDFSKIESGKFRIVPINFRIRLLFENINSLSRIMTIEKDIEFKSSFDTKLPEIVCGDENRMWQIYTNIINNAIKYTQKGYVNFILKKEELNGQKYISAIVKDSGIGIKKDDLKRIFLSFEQANREFNRGATGTGLGLTITKQLISLMGGTIDVESSFGKGSTFTVRLPLIKGDKSRLESELHINEIVYAKNREDVRALVVDDMPVNLLVFSGFLEKHNIVPDTAASGREAVEAVKNNKYDIIFMDHMMSDMDGIEAAKQIRSLEGKYHKIIPIIAVSANATADYKQLFLKSGMNDFLSKPVNAIGLNDILCKWLAPEKLKHGDRRRTERRQSVLRKEKSGRRAGELSNKDEAIFERLSKIEGLDTDAGLKHSDGKIKSYIAVLQQFCDNFEESSNCIKNSKEKKDWKDYAIRVHAYKGVFAIIGHAALFAWSRKLEYAAKMLDGALDKIKTSVETEKNLLPDDLDNALAICEEECDAYLGSIRALRNRLVKSALGYIQNEKKGKISRGDLAVLLKALAESSRGYKTKEAEKIVRTLKRCSVNAEIDIEIAKIIRLVRNFDYEAAVAKIQKLGS